MSNNIITKYAIGDVVYAATTYQEYKQHPCPDCLGTGKWKAISPAGTEYSFNCPRCSVTYQNDRRLSLKYSQMSPTFQRLTIGSIKVDTNNQERPIEYMTHETGIGSGRLWPEDRLFLTEEEAMEKAKILAEESNKNIKWIADQYDATLRLCDYQLSEIKKMDRKLCHLESLI